jgi:hypothetical protein
MEMSQVRAPAEEHGTGGQGGAVPFEGFEPPESNFWRLPNNWFDLAARFSSWAEHKVVEYILRHTWGYHEYGIAKLITMDEFMHGRKRRDGTRLDAGCGMAENSIKKGIADAVAHGFLIVTIDDSDKGRIKKYYAPRMRRPPADEGEHAISHRDQGMTGQGQSLTPRSQALTLDPHTLTLQAPDPIPTAQPLTPSRPGADARTEETPPETHPRQDTASKTPPVAALPGLAMRGRQGSQGDVYPSEYAPSATSVAPGSVPSGRPATHGRVRDRARRAAAEQLPGDHGPRPVRIHPHSPASNAEQPPVALRPAPADGSSRPTSAPSASSRRLRVSAVGRSPVSSDISDLAARLVAEGVGAAKARALAATFPAERIERQLAWIDSRNYRDRAATLVASIEADFAAPPRRPGGIEAAGLDRGKYFRGSYALCPHCGCRPCAPNCGAAQAPVARRG